MKKNSKHKDKEHPEITHLKHICEVSPDTETTKSVCEKVNKAKKSSTKQKKS